MTAGYPTQGPGAPGGVVAVVGVGVLLFVLDCLLAVRRGWSPFASRLELGVVVVVAVVAAGLALVGLLPAVRRWLRARRLAAAAIAIGLAGALVLAELLLALAGDRIERAPFHLHPRGLRAVFEPTLPGTSPVARFSVNSLGLRASEPPDDPAVFRILCVGGSTTEDVYIDDELTWTRQLGELLTARGGRRYWSASAGRSGFATPEHLRFLRDGSVVEQFDAVVLLVGINDLARLVWGESTDRVADRAIGSLAPLWARLRLLALVKRLYSAVEPGNLVMDREALFVHDGQTRRHEAAVIDGEVDLEPALAGYRTRLEAIVAAGRARGLSVVLADQPTLFRDDLTVEEEARLWFLRRADGTYLPARRMRALMDRFNQVTVEVAAATAAPLVPLTAMNGDGVAFYDDCHFSETGSATVAAHGAGAIDWSSLPLRPRRRGSG